MEQSRGGYNNRALSGGVKDKQDKGRREACPRATVTRLAWGDLGLLGPPEAAAPEKQLWGGRGD